MNVIPAIDLQGGKCVRLLKGDFAQTTEYSDDPAAVARQFAELGTTDLHVVDLDGARSGIQDNHSIIATIAMESELTVQVGGGIRDRQTVEEWLAAGVSRCVVGSLAITEPDAVKSWLVAFGADKIVLALDVKIEDGGVPMITTHGWTRTADTSVYESIGDFHSVGLRHVLCTDVSRDGAMAGVYSRLSALPSTLMLSGFSFGPLLFRFFNELQQFTLGHNRVVDVEAGKLVLARMTGRVQGV